MPAGNWPKQTLAFNTTERKAEDMSKALAFLLKKGWHTGGLKVTLRRALVFRAVWPALNSPVRVLCCNCILPCVLMQQIAKVWEAEQKEAAIDTRNEERRKQLAEEAKVEELKRLQISAGHLPKSSAQRLDWIYNVPMAAAAAASGSGVAMMGAEV